MITNSGGREREWNLGVKDYEGTHTRKNVGSRFFPGKGCRSG